MQVSETAIPGVFIIQPRVHRDARGGLAEWWRKTDYAAAGITDEFVQDNVSWSHHGVLRGLHYQSPRPQSKLITVLSGIIFDVAVDLRRDSTTFGQWISVELSAETMQQLYIPCDCAHGYLVLSETAIVSYRCGDYYTAEYDRALRWNDPEIGIAWPTDNPVLSEKDRNAPLLSELLTVRRR